MTPTIPFEFEPSSSSFETSHLEYKHAPGGQTVSWPSANVSFFVPEHNFGEHPRDIVDANPGHFLLHGNKGFSSGNYTELLVANLPQFMAFKMNDLEISFGQASPLIAYLFNWVHREKYFGPWEHITSARIIGVQSDMVEIAFLNASIHYSERCGALPTPLAMDESMLWWEEPDAGAPDTLLLGPPVKDLDPLRFYYHGLAQSDNTAACIYFFRTIEFYSFLMNQSKLTKIRHDTSLSEIEYAKRVFECVTRDEKGPLLQLINQIADNSIINKAFADGLMPAKNCNSLGESIYTFRNSIVHGKQSFGYILQSSSVINDDESVPPRRALLQKLARKAIEAFGSPLL